MNILPKKRWHVRTKENIARVRKDEAEAAEKEKQERLRTEKADREARLNVLKNKSKQKLLELGITESLPDPNIIESSSEIKTLPSEHINLFANFENAVKSSNKQHDKELKDKKEEYEKKIGYLTYLGQDTNEALGKKNWYEVLPEKAGSSRSNDIKDTYDKLVLKDEDGNPKTKDLDIKNGEISWKRKQELDPINTFKHLHNSSRKHKTNTSKTSKTDKKYKSIKEDKVTKLQKLREARLKREQQEKHRTKLFLSGINEPVTTEPVKDTKIKAKYNSQFNPELARQNYR